MNEHYRLLNKRPYRMRRRAEQVDETRERITAAAVRLHTTIGPAATSIAGVAEEAGVTRLTVYRHFPTMDALFAACSAHWLTAHPMPDPARWASLPTLGGRARAGLGNLYHWYRTNDTELFPIQRDLDALPAVVREEQAGGLAAWSRAIVGGPAALAGDRAAVVGDETAVLRVTALAGHLVGYGTWRSLVRDGGLTDADGADLGAMLLERVAES